MLVMLSGIHSSLSPTRTLLLVLVLWLIWLLKVECTSSRKVSLFDLVSELLFEWATFGFVKHLKGI
jgi:hypothetical protein